MNNLANAIAITACYQLHLKAATRPLNKEDFLGLFLIAPRLMLEEYSCR